jgi:small subunit ribosomal protein S19e
MPSIFDVEPGKLIAELAKELKQYPEIKAPAWSQYVKTGVHKERPPIEVDWWYTRTAAVLRSVLRLGPIGVSKLRTKYGGKKNRGHKTEHTYKGSGSIARKALQQLEAAGLIKKAEKGVHKGRVVSDKGKKLLSSIAKKLYVAPAKAVKIDRLEQTPDEMKAKKPAKHKEAEEAAPEQ